MKASRSIVPPSEVVHCFRCAASMVGAVESIEQQTRISAEVILADEASGSGTLDILRVLTRQYPAWIKVIAPNAHKIALATKKWFAKNRNFADLSPQSWVKL